MLHPQESDFSFAGVLNFIPPEDRDDIINVVNDALIGNFHEIIEFRIISADDTERIVLSKSEIIFDEKDNLVRLKGTVQDITERKRIEKELLDSEEKYRNIVETANEGIIIIYDKAIVTFANQKMCVMFGYSLEEGIGKTIWEFVSEESRAIVEMNMNKWWQGINETFELKLECKDGSPLWALVNAKPLLIRKVSILAL